MKLVFLNTMNGGVDKPLRAFLAEKTNDTDIFCFQEAYETMRHLASETLTGYRSLYKHKFVSTNDDFHQLVYCQRNLDLVETGTIFGDKAGVGLGLYLHVKTSNGDLYVCNYHGMSRPIDKLDTQKRIMASRGLIDFFKDKDHVVIGGDFNLFPQNESIKLFAENGYRDLINEFDIKNTRNRLIWEKYPNNPRQYYSDYTFTKGVAVKSFSAPNIEISDHLPLILELA
ncbi:MAG TPA: endonuclease/exonuclease/phosphatase family protein [Candidatus Saccharimonadales bacterium]|nr:endonuclease/exonuclease/phosphatase family protein [Candidatus Saccharimonadales bacterium]